MVMYDNSLAIRECEVKFALPSLKEIQKIKSVLEAQGFTAEQEQLETDFISDTPEFLCRKNKLILRFRRIQTLTTDDILLTLKVGNTTKNGLKDTYELQYYYSDVRQVIFDEINKILTATTGIPLPFSIHKLTTLKDIQYYLAVIGYSSLRVFVDKKRITYIKGDIIVTFDTFPRNIGEYLEIETQTPQELTNIINLLHLPKEQLDLRNYGEIVKAKQASLSEEKRKIALF